MAAFGIEVTVKGGGKGGKIYQFENDLSGDATLEEFRDYNQRMTFTIAREVLKEEQVKGFDKEPRVRTDNVFDRDDRQIKPFGKIEYFAKTEVGPAIIEIFEALLKRSPIDSGQYNRGHRLYYNGTIVASTLSEVKTFAEVRDETGGFKPGDEIRILNVNPYARRLEFLGVRRGKTGRNMQKTSYRKSKTVVGELLSKPNGAYYLAFRAVRRKYKSLASTMRFTFVPGGANGVNVPTLPGARTTYESNGRPYIYPSIVFKLSGEGILQ